MEAMLVGDRRRREKNAVDGAQLDAKKEQALQAKRKNRSKQKCTHQNETRTWRPAVRYIYICTSENQKSENQNTRKSGNQQVRKSEDRKTRKSGNRKIRKSENQQTRNHPEADYHQEEKTTNRQSSIANLPWTKAINHPTFNPHNNAFSSGNPFSGAKLLGFSIGRGFGALGKTLTHATDVATAVAVLAIFFPGDGAP